MAGLIRFVPYFFASCLLSCVTTVVSNGDAASGKDSLNAKKLSDVYTELAIEYQKRGVPQVALERVNLAIDANPGNARAYMLRGIIYQGLAKEQQAEENFNLALRIDKNYGEAYTNYAAFLCARGDYIKALSNFNLALNNPLYYNPEIAYFKRANCYYQAGKLELATADYLKVLTYRNPPADTYMALAKVEYQTGNYNLANYYMNKFSGKQTATSLWLHVQILQGLIDAENNSSTKLRYSKYQEVIGKLLVTNYSGSDAALQYQQRYLN